MMDRWVVVVSKEVKYRARHHSRHPKPGCSRFAEGATLADACWGETMFVSRKSRQGTRTAKHDDSAAFTALEEPMPPTAVISMNGGNPICVGMVSCLNGRQWSTFVVA